MSEQQSVVAWPDGQATQEQYVGKGGTRCPICGSDEISGGSVEVDAGTASQEVTCQNCGADWKDVYNLVGFDLGSAGG